MEYRYTVSDKERAALAGRLAAFTSAGGAGDRSRDLCSLLPSDLEAQARLEAAYGPRTSLYGSICIESPLGTFRVISHASIPDPRSDPHPAAE